MATLPSTLTDSYRRGGWRWLLVAYFAAACTAGSASAAPAPPAPERQVLRSESLQRPQVTADVRLRGEHAEQGNVRDGDALTLRARLGLRSASYNGISAVVEGEHVEAFNNTYNSTTNGNVDRAVIPDPEATELNQAYLQFQRGGNRLQIGRMRTVLDNARLVGDIVFRQNQQTFDGIAFENTALAGHRFRYQYMNRAHRPLGDDNPRGEFDMRTHSLHYRWQRLNASSLSAYLLLLEMRNRELTTRSHKTIGVRYEAQVPVGKQSAFFGLEYARQSDYADGAAGNDANYLHLEARATLENAWVLGVGFEHLGGDGDYGFQTPLATAHKFSGFADVFVTSTPPTGINDLYATLRLPLFGGTLALDYHLFDPVEGGGEYGKELDAIYTLNFARRWQVGLKFADYREDGFGVDTRRVWTWLGYSL